MFETDSSGRAGARRIGPYRVGPVLGRGGMSVVYRAEHEGSGQRVALKTLHLASESHLASIRREIHALSRVRHEGVVRIFEHGIEGGAPWYAMELLDGETLADVRRRDGRRELWQRDTEGAPDVVGAAATEQPTATATFVVEDGTEPPLPSYAAARAPVRAAAEAAQLAALSTSALAPQTFTRVLRIVRRLCDALAYIHGEGLVHRDLKPENVVIRPGERPVLLDFGLAWPVSGGGGREVADVVQSLAGTPGYMSPEQIRMETLDPRADLYGLGCLLYELVTGRRPFVGRSWAAVVRQHIEDAPTPPSLLVDGVPEALDALILGLLAKDRRDRVGYAADVAAALDAMLPPETADPAAAAAAADSDSPRARPYVYRPRLAGREAIVQRLLFRLSRADLAQGSCVLISGESGIGKTYLAAELARRAAGTQLHVVVGTCQPSGTLASGRGAALAPLRPLMQHIVDRCIAEGPGHTAQLLGRAGLVLASVMPFVGEAPGLERFGPPPVLSGQAARARLLASVRIIIEAFCERQPLLLLLDDLQWADELTLALLDELPSQWFGGRKVALLATVRSEAKPEQLSRFAARDDVDVVHVGRLDNSTTAAVVGDMLALETPPPRLVELVTHKARGNPFFVAEYLRAAVSEGLVQRGATPSTAAPVRVDIEGLEQLSLPSGVRELVAWRLGRLDRSARAMLELASVIGSRIERALLESAAADLDGAGDAMDAIDTLLARDVFVAVGQRQNVVAFAHDIVREVTYEHIDEARRGTLHRLAAERIEALHAGELAPYAASLARHRQRCGDIRAAIDYLYRAAAHDSAAAAYRQAEAHLRQGLELLDTLSVTSDTQRGRFELALGRALYGSGDLAAAESHLRAGMALLDVELPRSRAGWASTIGRGMARQLMHRAGVGFDRAADPASRERLAEIATSAAMLSNRYFFADDALALVGTSLLTVNVAERAGVEDHVPACYSYLGFLSGIVRAHGTAERYYERAIGGARRREDAAGLSISLVSRSVYCASFGRFAEAERCAAEALDAITGMHDPPTEELAHVMLGHVEHFTGRTAAARERYLALLDRARARRSPQHVTWGLFSVARSLVREARCAEALPLLAEARAALERRPELQSEIICSGLFALASLRCGDARAAERLAAHTLLLVERARPTGFVAVDGYAAAGQVLLEHARAASHRDERRRRARPVRRLAGALDGLARAFPVAEPAALLYRAELDALDGRLDRSRERLVRAGALASKLGMPYEAAAAAQRTR
ncbi:MAG: AAA family ATPase [Myxococcales bacterium]|nr:AAA family ATPase [Myxococcales bacterium]